MIAGLFKFLQITQDLNKIKKNPEHPFADKVSGKRGQNFSKTTLNSMVVGAHKSFQFFMQNTWFLGNNRALPKFYMEFFIN